MRHIKLEFLNKVIKTKTCWLWVGYITKKGYGRFFFKYKQIAAHRKSYEIFNGEIKPGMWVLHKCDIRNCVNPAHLYQGTEWDNAMDATKRKRWAYGKKNGTYKYPERVHRGENASWSKLSEKDVINILKCISLGEKQNAIAKRFNVTPANINEIYKGKIWKHITT